MADNLDIQVKSLAKRIGQEVKKVNTSLNVLNNTSKVGTNKLWATTANGAAWTDYNPEDKFFDSTVISEGSSYTVKSNSNNYIEISISTSTFTLAFTAANSGIFARKYIHLSTSTDTSVTYSGAVFSNSEENPTWGLTGHKLLLEAIFIAGRVVLNVIDNDQISDNIS